jgi:hypothetical protein
MPDRWDQWKYTAEHSRFYSIDQGNSSAADRFRLFALAGLEKNLTRRANHRHIVILAAIEPAPGNRSRAFCIAASAQKILKISAVGVRHMREDCAGNRNTGNVDGARSGSKRDAGFGFCWAPPTQKAVHVIFWNADHSTKPNAAVPRRGRDIARYLIAISALVLSLTQAPSARADSASWLAKVSAYVADLDELLSKERNWNTPYMDLTKRSFPIYDCEADALLEVVSGSRFIRSISYHSRTNQYLILFSNGDADASVAYLVSEKKSNAATADFPINSELNEMPERIFLTYTNATVVPYDGSVLGHHIVLNYVDSDGVHHTLPR